MSRSIRLESEIRKVLDSIDSKEYPEISGFLEEILEEEELEDDEMFDIANTVAELDAPKPFPPEVIEFITMLYEWEIDKGNAAAMNNLGSQYYDGNRGFEQSFSKAVELYKMAAENGDRQAQENLGYCYYYGRNMEPDYEKAFQYFAMGAFDGHLISLYKIGDMYLNGYYVRKNEKEAFIIYMHCVDIMTDEAAPKVAGPIYLRLGKMFLNGIGTEKNLSSALVCFQKAEGYLYDMVKGGNYMYKKSLLGAIEGQEKVRKEMMEQLPEREWEFD